VIAPRNRARNILLLADQIRERHSIEDRRVRWPELRAMLDAEGIAIKRVRMRARAYVTGADGTFVIALRRDINIRDALKRLLHEYSHAKLHFGDDEVERQLVPCRRGDPREDEANLLAALLWHGPEATPDHPAIARLVARLEAADHQKRAPRQIPLELPEPMPRVLTAADLEYEEEIERERGKSRRRAKLPDAKRVRIARPTEPFAATYIDRDGRVWWIYDRSDRRGFYHSHLVRKVYRFHRGEVRVITAARLDRQLIEARALHPHHLNRVSTSRRVAP
jgi:hypothetical protein